MTELLPCPFCGGEAELLTGALYEVQCRNCYRAGTWLCDTEAEAIAAWNTRAERTCELICHEVELPDSLKDADFEMYVYECSECGEPMFSDYNYCPNCGAHVTKSDQYL